MGQGFKEVATLRGNDKKFQENFSKIKWEISSGNKGEDTECEPTKSQAEDIKLAREQNDKVCVLVLKNSSYEIGLNILLHMIYSFDEELMEKSKNCPHSRTLEEAIDDLLGLVGLKKEISNNVIHYGVLNVCFGYYARGYLLHKEVRRL